MHILHIVATMRPEAGGLAEAVRMLVKYQPEGYTSEVLTLDAPTPGSPYTDLGPVNSPTFVYSPRLNPWLRANRHRFDGVLLHGLWQHTSVAALRTLPGHVPYVVFTHGMLDPYFKRRYPLKHFKKWPFWLLCQYWLLRRAHCVLFTTTAERDLAAQSFWLHRWKPVVIPLGTEPPPPITPANHEAFLELCPTVRGKDFLLYLGRIDPKKGCDLLLRAFAATAALSPTTHLVMAGPDPANWQHNLKQIALQAGVADRVHWPGMVQGEAKLGAFDLCEAFILPSHQENFGIAVVEALAAARPVLITDKVNIAPHISTEACGYVENDGPNGVVAMLTKWFQTSSQEKQEMGLQASRLFKAQFDMSHNAQAILKVFEQPPTPPAEPA